MKTIMRYGFILGVTCVLAAGFLAAVNAVTQPKIFAQHKQQEERVLAEVLSGAARFEAVKSPDGNLLYYKAYDKDNNAAGIAFKADARGYADGIEIMAGMDNDGRITVIRILSQNETPGLGSRINEPHFLSQFNGKDVPGLDNVQAITGATISSGAVINAVKDKAKRIQSLLKNGQ